MLQQRPHYSCCTLTQRPKPQVAGHAVAAVLWWRCCCRRLQLCMLHKQAAQGDTKGPRNVHRAGVDEQQEGAVVALHDRGTHQKGITTSVGLWSNVA